MPYYRCLVPKGSISFEKRQEIATAFTDIHCESTGAPRGFVHVVFDEQAEDGRSKFPNRYYIDGGNRAGRSEDVKQKLISDLVQAFSQICTVPAPSVGGRITESPASWSMEGGAVLPEPGEEGVEWYSHTR